MRGIRGATAVRRAWKALPVVAAALLVAGAACVEMDPALEPERIPVTPTEEATATATAIAAATVAASPTPEPTPYDGALAFMRIPSLGVDAPIEAIGKIPGLNKLDVPLPRNVGWYDIYDKPGFGTNSLYSAHKDWYPDIRGPFYALAELEAGDLVVVVMDDGREYVYEVFFQRRYTTAEVPMRDLIAPHEADDPELLRPAGQEWVTLITCGGDFIAVEEDGPGYYAHRDVVIARLVETRLVRTVEGGD